MPTMKAIRMHAFGDVEVLHYDEIEQPEPRPGEVLVQVHAAGVNPVDWGARSYPMPTTTGAADASLPYILGWDLAGTVVKSGPGVTRFAPGAAVYGMPSFPKEAKAYAQYAAVPAHDLALKPLHCSYEQAAALPMAALTAWQALFDTAQLQRGETVFIPGAAGGVGHLALQLAKWKGARVIAATSDRNLAFVRDLGADIVMDYTSQTLEELNQEIDVVLDMMDERLLEQSCASLRPGGRIVSLIRAHNELGNRLASQIAASFSFILVHPSGEQLTQIATLCDQGLLHVSLQEVLPLNEVARAHQLSAGRHVRGKLVLKP